MRGKNAKLLVGEMRELRSQGYSNDCIAKMLDIGTSTVYRALGKQGGHMQTFAAFKDKPKGEAKAMTPVEAIPPYVPKVSLETYDLGNDVTVTIDYNNEHIVVRARQSHATTMLHDSLVITYDQARELVQFLAWASVKCKPKEEAASEAE